MTTTRRTSRQDKWPCVRIPPELHAQLKAAADEHQVSVGRLLRDAIPDYLGRLIPADQFALTREPPTTGEPTP